MKLSRTQTPKFLTLPRIEEGGGGTPQRVYGPWRHDQPVWSFRDIDHTNQQVRRDIIKYLLQLKSIGYRGWRYDMVHGYHAKWISVYNRASQPTFSVGEYDWGAHPGQRGWTWYTATIPGDLRTSTSVFEPLWNGQRGGGKGRAGSAVLMGINAKD